MLLEKVLGQLLKNGKPPVGCKETEGVAQSVRVEAAFFRISCALRVDGELSTILEVIARESLNCLKANRSSIFCLDAHVEILKTQFSYFLDSRYQQVGLVEEKEMAQKALIQSQPLLLKNQESISGLLNADRENKIHSLMCIPLLARGKPRGVISVVLINEIYNFDEKNLRLFSSFANLASTAMELAELREETLKRDNLGNTYGGYLDSILEKLRNLSEKEQPVIHTHILRNPTE